VIDGEVDHEQIRPDNLPLRDVAYVLTQLARAVHALASEEPSEALGQPVSLSLIGIHDGSGRYEIKCDKRGNRHAGRIIDALESRDGSKLSPRARDAVQKIHGRARKNGWSTYSIESRQASGVRVARVKPLEKIFDQPAIVGGTSVLALINKVGGDIGKGRAEIYLPGKHKVNAKVKTTDLAVELGKLLYQTIELQGNATYSPESMEIREFEIHRIGKYIGSDPVDAINQLSDLDSQRWDGIDVVAHVESHRNEGDAE